MNDYYDGYIWRRRLAPPISMGFGQEITNGELLLLCRWAQQGKIDLVQYYAMSIHQRVWDEYVDVRAIERICRELLTRRKAAA